MSSENFQIETIEKEREKSTFNVEELSIFLYGGEEEYSIRNALYFTIERSKLVENSVDMTKD